MTICNPNRVLTTNLKLYIICYSSCQKVIYNKVKPEGYLNPKPKVTGQLLKFWSCQEGFELQVIDLANLRLRHGTNKTWWYRLTITEVIQPFSKLKMPKGK